MKCLKVLVQMWVQKSRTLIPTMKKEKHWTQKVWAMDVLS
jgi:hypothetical protein